MSQIMCAEHFARRLVPADCNGHMIRISRCQNNHGVCSIDLHQEMRNYGLELEVVEAEAVCCTYNRLMLVE
jgi:hypothetical protein